MSIWRFLSKGRRDASYSDADAARTLYMELAEHASTVGAYSFVTKRAARRLRLEDRQTRVAAVYDQISPDRDPISGSGRLVFEVPSPWHAVIHLLVNNRSWLAGHNSGGTRMALVYRGQRNATWPLMPSIRRSGVDVNAEQLTTDAFVNLFGRLLNTIIQATTDFISPSLLVFQDEWRTEAMKLVHTCTAQHFGIKTELLDFTVDPAVAVWFACQGANDRQQDRAVVFALPTAVAASVGSKLIFPHPYVLRLFRQRGLFVTQPDTALLRKLCIEVRFPPDPRFKIFRDGRSQAELLPRDEWWMDIIALAREIAKRGHLNDLLALRDKPDGNDETDDTTSPEDGLLRFLERIKLQPRDPMTFFFPGFLHRSRKRDLLIEMSDHLIQMLLCLTTAIDGNLGSPVYVSDASMQHFVRHSGRTLRALLPIVETRLQRLPVPSALRQIALPALNNLRTAMISGGVPPFGPGWEPLLG